MQNIGTKSFMDTLGYRLNSKNANSNGVFSSDNFNQAMEFKSQGATGNGQTQFSSYVISFTTQHTDSYEVGLTTGPKNQQFSGIAANIYSYQNGYYNMFSSLYGEQRALNPAGAPLKAKDVVSDWDKANTAMAKIHTDYLNNAQINVLRNKIQNNITDSDALTKIINEGNSLNDAMKNLGNSIGQYDSDGKFTDHKVDTTKASDRYQYADSDTKSTYDNTTNAVSNIIDKSNGTYADQATVEKLTDDENKAWSALNGVKPTDTDKITPNVPEKKVPVANTSNLTETEKYQVKKNVEDANKGNFPDGTVVTVGADGTATVTYPDKSTDTINGSDLVPPHCWPLWRWASSAAISTSSKPMRGGRRSCFPAASVFPSSWRWSFPAWWVRSSPCCSIRSISTPPWRPARSSPPSMTSWPLWCTTVWP